MKQLPAILHVFDVGQGDSILLEMPDSSLFVVDCCSNSSTDLNPPVLQYLKTLRSNEKPVNIDFLCLTHPDYDHFRGMDKVLNWVEGQGGRIKNLILFAHHNKEFNEERARFLRNVKTAPARNLGQLRQRHNAFTSLYEKLANIKEKLGPSGFFRACGFQHVATLPIPYSPPVEIYIFGPTALTAENATKELWKGILSEWFEEPNGARNTSNAISCTLLIKYGEATIFLAGDATAEAWGESIEAYETSHRGKFVISVASNIVKASHHGAASGSSEVIWTKMLKERESKVVISAGCHNGFLHPHEETLRHLVNCPAQPELFCTNSCRRGPLSSGVQTPAGSALNEDLPKLDRVRLTEKQKYHGDCRFEIFPDGQIIARTERQPLNECAFHRTGGSVGALRKVR